jgi:hypothetical protein
MDSHLKTILQRQFFASLDMLENALRLCPDELWGAPLWTAPGQPQGFAEFYYLAYHCLFFLDLYLSGQVEGFAPPAPYNLDELDPAGLLPERRYSREELLAYLDYGRRKCHTAIDALDDETARRLCSFPWGEMPYLELLLDNLRHVQEHAAQLNLFLGQQQAPASRWVAISK